MEHQVQEGHAGVHLPLSGRCTHVSLLTVSETSGTFTRLTFQIGLKHNSCHRRPDLINSGFSGKEKPPIRVMLIANDTGETWEEEEEGWRDGEGSGVRASQLPRDRRGLHRDISVVNAMRPTAS